MRVGVLGCATVVGVFTLTCATFAQARPQTPAGNRYIPYRVQAPRCDDAEVLSTLRSRFSQRESYYWKSGLEIEGFELVSENPRQAPGYDTIPRRYCRARALMNDHHIRAVAYSIGEDLNMTGGDAVHSLSQSLTFGFFPAFNANPSVNWGVEWCVSGLDRSYTHSLLCRAAGP